MDQVVGPFVGHWRLRAAKDRLGAAFYVGAFQQAWVELTLGGEFIGQWTYSETRDEGVTPSAFDANGILYGERWIGGKRAGISVFDRSTGVWKPFSPALNGHLLGADGTHLVYQTGDTLRWIAGASGQSAQDAQ